MRLVGFVLLVGFAGAYFWWIITAAVIVGLVWLAVKGYEAAQLAAAEEARRHQRLVSRADQQHAWVLAGDDRGVFGDGVASHRVCMS